MPLLATPTVCHFYPTGGRGLPLTSTALFHSFACIRSNLNGIMFRTLLITLPTPAQTVLFCNDQPSHTTVFHVLFTMTWPERSRSSTNQPIYIPPTLRLSKLKKKTSADEKNLFLRGFPPAVC
jgi:hypothetical protein